MILGLTSRRVLPAAVAVVLACVAVAVASPVVRASSATSLHVYWGDLHAHTRYSTDARVMGATNIPSQALEYARSTARLDFCAIIDHDYSLSKSLWTKTQDQVNDANDAGRFATLLGYEWTESTDYGHKQVLFRSAKVPAEVFASFTRVGDESSVRSTPQALWSALAKYDCMTVPHTVAEGSGLSEDQHPSQNWDYVNARQQTVVEVFSKHGANDVPGTIEAIKGLIAERTVEAALGRWLTTGDAGYQLGIVGGTDDHRGLPGSVTDHSPPASDELPYGGALTAVYAKKLTRTAIYDAIKGRYCYATSGPRIRLQFAATADGASVRMGGFKTLSGPTSVTLTVNVKGDSAPIEKVEVIASGEVVATRTTGSFSLVWPVSSRTYFRIVAYQQPTLGFEGEMVNERAWSSPIWFEVGAAR